MALRRKREESTNDKIVRLYQEGKSVSDICAEVGIRNDIVTGVIQRKLGPDAVPDAVIPHEKNPAAEVIAAASAAPASEVPAAPAADTPSSEDLDGMSKLERYMFEKKRKMEAEAEAYENTPVPEAVPETTPSNDEPLFGTKSPVFERPAITEPEIPAPSLSFTAPEPKEEVHKVSLVEEYTRTHSSNGDNMSSSSSSMEGISLVSDAIAETASKVPSYTIPSAGESYAEMDALVPPDLESADVIADAPILSYDRFADHSDEDASAETAAEAPAVETSAASDPGADVAGKAANKMKAFALSQIEANNAKIAELESRSASIKNEYSAKIEAANTALTLSQSSFDTIETQLNDAYKASEQARDEHSVAIAAIDDDYRRKLAALDEEYRTATFEANNKYQELDDKNRETIERLDGEKTAAQADLVAKRKAVADIHAVIDTESEKLGEQIKALKEENAGYQAFL